jgi:alpha-L-rhamnosidase
MTRKFSLPFLLTFLFSTIVINTSFTTDKTNPEANIIEVFDLKCEYAVNPIGMDIQSPQLSWRIESEKRGVFQGAFQIMVADSPEDLANNIADLWDSGIIKSSKSTGVEYAGPELQSRKRYYWKVRVWNSDNTMSDWSETAFFEMGLLNQEDWQSEWLGFTPGRTGRVLYFKGIDVNRIFILLLQNNLKNG